VFKCECIIPPLRFFLLLYTTSFIFVYLEMDAPLVDDQPTRARKLLYIFWMSSLPFSALWFDTQIRPCALACFFLFPPFPCLKTSNLCYHVLCIPALPKRRYQSCIGDGIDTLNLTSTFGCRTATLLSHSQSMDQSIYFPGVFLTSAPESTTHHLYHNNKKAKRCSHVRRALETTNTRRPP
jgi:hypothetical protein